MDDRGTENEKELWEGSYSSSFDAGVLLGIISSAKVAQRKVIIDMVDLSQYDRASRNEGFAKAIKIDANKDCNYDE